MDKIDDAKQTIDYLQGVLCLMEFFRGLFKILDLIDTLKHRCDSLHRVRIARLGDLFFYHPVEHRNVEYHSILLVHIHSSPPTSVVLSLQSSACR